ncbi:MAG: AbrB/MazE/SpoVT family DNA-binding domain-containing protein [Candidatus Woesearchaeota archaeon]
MGRKNIPKIVQIDSRGQIVIPKSIRSLLDLREGEAFWIFPTNGEITLKKIEQPENEK